MKYQITGQNFGLISLDQEKAFDRIEVLDVLKNVFVMVKVLYGDTERVVKVNGGLSAPLKVRRAVRQGCSMSRIAIEPFLCKLRGILGVSLYKHIGFIYLLTQMM